MGPLVICAASIEAEEEKELKKLGAKDSKMLTPVEREKLYPKILKMCEVSVISIDAKELDSLMERMSLNEIEAMKIGDALQGLSKHPDKIFVDAPDTIEKNFTKRLDAYVELGYSQIISEHKADVNYPIVSAASIVAKVERDRQIEQIKNELGIDFGNGYPHDPKTIALLEKEWKPGLEKYVRMRWKTLINIEDRKWQRKLGQWD